MKQKITHLYKKINYRKDIFKEKQNQRNAWKHLERNGGVTAVKALKDGFAVADRYRTWDIWSLHPTATIWVADLISQGKVNHLIEFGAGYSTIALSEFVRQIAPKVRIDSFEHQSEYADRINAYIPDNCLTQLHCVDLFQLDDANLAQLYVSNIPNQFFMKNATPVSQHRYHETRLHNAFYHFNFQQWESNSIDLIMLDGPNGNGRSIAFPLLRHAMRFPGWALIDDYLDYPFLSDLLKIYSGETTKHTEANNNEFALVSLTQFS